MHDRVNVPLLGLFLVAIAVTPTLAHNGEYIPPELTRPPSPIAPGSPPGMTPGPTTGGPGPRTPRPGGPSTGRRTDPVPTPDPTSVRRSGSFGWEAAFEILRRGLPTPPPTQTPAELERVREGLRRLLPRKDDEDPNLAALAALALGRLGDVQTVVAALREDKRLAGTVGILGAGLAARAAETDDARREALSVLVPVILGADSAASARGLAAIAAGLCGESAARPLLAALEDCDHPGVRSALLLGLGLSGHPEAREVLLDEVVPPSKASRKEDAPELRALLVYALSQVRAPEVVSDLIRRFSDPADEVRAAAALSLAGRLGGHPSARAGVIELARNGPDAARAAAILALALEADPETAKVARKALRDPVHREGDLGGVAALALGVAASAEDAPGLVRMFANRKLRASLRSACAVGAGLTRARGLAEEFEKAVKAARDPGVQVWGLVGLSMVDGGRATPLLARFVKGHRDPRLRRTAMIALGYAGGEDAVKLLVAALGDSFWVNREAAQALCRADPTAGADEILGRLADGANPHARRFAAVALGRPFDRRVPSFFEEVLLRAGLGFGSPVERYFLFLEFEFLARR